ncbi:lysozyme inhibitor LprI family protein [Alloyangia pacifica]|uniref:lysozyme inhibitor LprI family protein n=1 Tax=Alloyangia pacifica TaxID=311180 RepID=UPI001CD8125A|nr:lysozyme inhibitor LprI family protein [Alloyangia pacifica]MCA0998390.1 lysozyme inhibitor LprI family protein [Alloyangia pacifica]
MTKFTGTLPAAGCRTKKNYRTGIFRPAASRAAALALLLSGMAGAASAACNEAKTTIEMGDCVRGEYEAADLELNRVYAQLKGARDEAFMAKVRDAQRAWIPFRDAACEAEGALYEGGSLQPIAQVSCLTKLTRRRSEDLRTLLSN